MIGVVCTVAYAVFDDSSITVASGPEVEASMARLSLSPSQPLGGVRAKDGPPPRFLEGEEGESPSWEEDYKAWEEKCAAGKQRKKRAPACALETTSSGVEGKEAGGLGC